MLDHDQIRARIIQRMTVEDLPLTGVFWKAAGVGQTTIRNFLDGSTVSLTIETINKIAPLLGTTEQWLLFGEHPPVEISEEQVGEMVANALLELQPERSLAETRPIVASVLHGQLKRHLAGNFASAQKVERMGRDRADQSPARQARRGSSRT